MLMTLALAAPPAQAQAQPRAKEGAQAVARDVRIRRDGFGVPHVLGRTDADAAFGLGYAHSEDDFPTMQKGLLTARGQLATVDGAAGVESDWMLHLMDVPATITRRYTVDLPADVRAVLEAYAAGINAYAAEHPELVTPGRTPFTGRDVAAYGMYRGPTFYGLDDVFSGLMRDMPKMAALDAEAETGRGSNGVAVAPSRSADGATRLLINSHQPFAGPFAWYEAVVESRQGWHVAGAFFPGSPFLLGGHNANLGWAPTVNRPDLTDVYALTVDPANPDRYRLDGAWRPFDKRFVDIAVRQPDGSMKTVRREVLRSAHGPAVRTAKGVFAVRYPGMTDASSALQYYRMNKARNLKEWRAAMQLGAIPSINYLYADDRGNIGFLPNARHPDRKPGVDWSGVVPGDRADLIWTREVPFAKRPQLWNPRSGYVFNANNTPFRATDPADDLKRDAYPETLGLQTVMTNRALRSAEVYGADSSITAGGVRGLQVRPRLQPAVGGGDGGQRHPGGRRRRRPRPAGRAAHRPRLGPAHRHRQPQRRPAGAHRHPAAGPGAHAQARRALLHAAAAGGGCRRRQADQGLRPHRSGVGRGQPHRRGSVDLPVDGGPDIFRAIYGGPDPKGRITAAVGDTYYMLVEWDRAGRLSSRSIHQFGSATLDVHVPPLRRPNPSLRRPQAQARPLHRNPAPPRHQGRLPAR
jgi:penicillin amidase/acyl-homoserine-lactone acylase